MKQFRDFSKIIHREGYIFIVLFAAATFLFASFSQALGWIGFVSTLFCAYFFRNPDRLTPVDDNLVISPADGVVQMITHTPAPSELNMGDEEMLRISIFLNIFNVHVNRSPVSGTVKALHYNPGKFLNASLDKASTFNERQSVVIETENKSKVICVQIAGLIARRIVCDLENGMNVKAGERYGIIRFGSRVDVYLPGKMIPLVQVGQTAIGGETVLADFSYKKVSAPKFEIR